MTQTANESYYAKTRGDSTFWLVEYGYRRQMASMDQVYGEGLKPVRTLSTDEMDAIPTSKPKRGKRDSSGSDADAGNDAASIPATE